MSKENSISITIPEADLKIVRDALALVQSTLAPYVVALTPEDRKSLPKMSDKSEPFVGKALEYGQSDPQFAPPFLDVPEMKKDVDVVYSLLPLLRAVDQIQDNLSDTTMIAGSEAYVAALSYYNSVKMAASMNIPGAKAIAEDLGKRFARSRKAVD